jgi:CRISPR system Cascade subunit CasE
VSEPSFFMVKLRLDAARLARDGFVARLPPYQDDTGILVHHQLAALFGEGTVQPFRTLGEEGRSMPALGGDRPGRWLPVLGYTREPEAELRERARRFADPDHYAGCDWESFASKPMPAVAEETRLGFELRACPVVRLASPLAVAGKAGEPVSYQAGAEVDAWVYSRWMAGERSGRESRAASREEVYGEWLRARIAGAAEVDAVHIEGFSRQRLVRRSHESPRRSRVLERPQALLRGELRVRDTPAFGRLLARGVGRHRSYGFGMLLLRPPRC